MYGEQTILVKDGQQAVVPEAMMTEANEYAFQNQEQFDILWGKITRTVPALGAAVRAADPLPETVPVAVARELPREDEKTLKSRLLKTEEPELKKLVERIKENPETSTEQKEEGLRYTEGVMTVVATKTDMVKYENMSREIVSAQGRGVTQDQLREVVQGACVVANRLISMGVQFQGQLVVELQAQATQLGLVTDEVRALSGRVLQNAQWLGNGIRGLHAHQEKMGAETFKNFQWLYTGLDQNFQQNLNVLNQIQSSVLSTKAEQEAVQKQLVELKEQAGQLVLQKDEQVGQLVGVLDELKSQTDAVSKAVQNGTELRAGLTQIVHQYLEQSKVLQDRCRDLVGQRDALEQAVEALQEVAGSLGEQTKARVEEVSQLSQSWAQGGAELMRLGNRSLSELSKVLEGVGRLEQAVVGQIQAGAETRALVESLSQAVKQADLERVAGLVAAQKQDRPDLTSMIPLIQAAVEAGLKAVPLSGLEPVMTQEQVMSLIKVVTDRYNAGAAEQAGIVAGHLAEFGRVLDQVRAEVAQNRDQRGPQAFAMPITVVQQVAAGLGSLKPISVPPVIDYGRVQFMTPAERIRELRSLAAQPQRRTKSRTSHGRVPLKSKLVDPALDEGRDVRRVTKARRVARVKKIEKRRTRDPLDVFLQGKYK